jgi:uncharacterized protein (TIRG00374 family)
MESIQTMFISLFVVWLIPIPVGTEIIRAFLIRDKKNSGLGKAIASVVVHKAYYNIAFGVLLIIAVFMVSVLKGDVIPIQPGIVLFVIVFAIGSSMIYGLFLSPKLLKAVYEKSPHWVKRNIFDRLVNPKFQDKGFLSIIDEIDYSVSTITSNPFSSFLSILLVAFHWSTGSITSYLVALSLNQPIDFWVIVLIYALIEFIQQLNIFIPGGLGIIDATLTGAFFVLGVPLSIASAISLLTRLATYWFEVFLCGIVSFRYGYKESLKEYMDEGLYR